MSTELTPEKRARIGAEQRETNLAQIKRGARELRGAFEDQLRKESARPTPPPAAPGELRVLQLILEHAPLSQVAQRRALRARLYLSDRLPDAKADDDGPADDSVRYLARRKANYSPLDLRRFSLADGVLIPDTVEPARTAYGVSGEFAKDIVRRAVRTLASRDIHGTAGTASSNYLPKLVEQYGLLDRLTRSQFGKIMRSLILDGQLVNEPVGQYPNRTHKVGLVLK